MNVLITVSHPDDEMVMLGTIMKHVKNGDKVILALATAGDQQGNPVQRLKDSAVCAKKMKAQLIIPGSLSEPPFKDTLLYERQSELIKSIEEAIKGEKPDRIYTHYPNDTHQDHRILSLATQTAGRQVKQIIFFESPSSQGFTPNYYVNIAPFFKKKCRLLKGFQPQYNRWFLEEKYHEANASFRGFKCGVKYAEAFEIMRLVE